MKLTDRLHCPRCKGRLSSMVETSGNDVSNGLICCTDCDWTARVADGVADFVGQRIVSEIDPHRLDGDPRNDASAAGELMTRIRSAAGDRWPASLGEVLELGCGAGQMTCGMAPGINEAVRSLVVTDTDLPILRACRDRLLTLGLGADASVMFARLGRQQDAIRDAVADTVAGNMVLSHSDDVRASLATVHRMLRPGGRAFFIIQNRRYYQALSHAAATALVCRYAHDGAWSEHDKTVIGVLALLRRQLVHHGDQGFLSTLPDKHMFNSEALEHLAQQVGFATVDVIPLAPDPLGGESAGRLCHQAALPQAFTADFAPLVASAGASYFSLLSHQDASADMLVWLTKGVGPRLRTFSAPPVTPTIACARPASALGGVLPRWSIELLARDSTDGVVVSLSGWCLINIDIVCVRLRLDDVIREAPVWRPRPDVHEILNGRGLYHPLNALCSGLDAALLFDGLHPQDNQCRLHLEIVLANGVVATGPAPDRVVMHETLIIIQ